MWQRRAPLAVTVHNVLGSLTSDPEVGQGGSDSRKHRLTWVDSEPMLCRPYWREDGRESTLLPPPCRLTKFSPASIGVVAPHHGDEGEEGGAGGVGRPVKAHADQLQQLGQHRRRVQRGPRPDTSCEAEHELSVRWELQLRGSVIMIMVMMMMMMMVMVMMMMMITMMMIIIIIIDGAGLLTSGSCGRRRVARPTWQGGSNRPSPRANSPP
jgi:hypothetical protein